VGVWACVCGWGGSMGMCLGSVGVQGGCKCGVEL